MCDQEQSRNKSVLQSNNNALTNEKEKKNCRYSSQLPKENS